MTTESLAFVAGRTPNRMKRQRGVGPSFLNRTRCFIALLSILAAHPLFALDLDPLPVGGYDTSGAYDVAVSGNYAYVADENAGLLVIDVSNPASPRRAPRRDQPANPGAPHAPDLWA